jgi:hypothetical protein
MDWPSIKEAVKGFPSRDLAAFNQVAEELVAKRAGQFAKPGFTHIWEGYPIRGNSFHDALARLVGSSLESGGKDTVDRLLTSINQGKWLQGNFWREKAG